MNSLILILQEITDKIFNEGFAWLSTIIGIILSFKLVTRILMQKGKIYKDIYGNLNKCMRYTHKPLGIILVITGLVHGIFSSEDVLSLNLGTMCWILSILTGISYMIRKSLSKQSNWIKYHRILTILFILTLGLHIIDVKFIKIGELNKPKNTEIINNDIYGDLSKYKFKDGNYEGVADGYGPNLTVSVEVKSNKIENIKIISHNEDGTRHYARAMDEIPQAITDTQNADVDVVSGATYTSKGIICAVKDALSNAIINQK